jgi:PHD/YefM family antitoxin component YafN of YafNO toxin-antitoxin module
MYSTLSVTSARQQLLKLTKDIGRRMGQVILTNKGEAQAVLLSMAEYNSLRAAAELVSHPKMRSASEEGFEQLRRGEGVKLAEAMPGVARKKSGAAQAVAAVVKHRPAEV